jgi:SHS2 domain-containing protein
MIDRVEARPSTIEPHAELFPHGADIGVRGIGPSRASAFEQAALALTSAVTDPTDIAARERIEVTCEAPDDAYLLLDWLNALIYEMAVRRLVFGRFAVSIEGHRLHGQAVGEPVDRSRHSPAVEPKGATLTALKVEMRSDGAWVAQCIVDV